MDSITCLPKDYNHEKVKFKKIYYITPAMGKARYSDMKVAKNYRYKLLKYDDNGELKYKETIFYLQKITIYGEFK